MDSMFRSTCISLVAILALACGPSPGGAPAPPASAPAAPAPGAGPVTQAQRGGIFQFAANSRPVSLLWYQGGTIQQYMTLGPIFQNILATKGWDTPGFDWEIQNEPAPSLAESWTQEGPTSYLFKLRQGVRWHDGEEFTADDVVFTYTWVLDPHNSFANSSRIRTIDTVSQLDRHTVRITTKTPFSEFLQQLAGLEIRVLPKHVFVRGGDFTKLEGVVGTGPFELKTFDDKTKAVLVRNDDYWENGRPYVDEIRIFYGLDASAVQAGLAARELDVFNFSDERQFEALRRSIPDLRFATNPGSYGYGLFMQVDKPPFNDLRVRQAIHLAIDRHGMLKGLTGGKGIINPPPPIPGKKTGWGISQEELFKMPGFDPSARERDVAEAKRLLAEAGYASGLKVGLMTDSGQRTTSLTTEPIASMLKAIGLDAEIQSLETGIFQTRRKDREFDLQNSIGAARMLPDGALWERFHSTSVLNQYGIKDATLDSLIEAQSREQDVAKRKAILRQIQNHIMQNVYFVPTIDLAFFMVWQPYVEGYVYNMGAQPHLLDAGKLWLDQAKMPKRR